MFSQTKQERIHLNQYSFIMELDMEEVVFIDGDEAESYVSLHDHEENEIVRQG